MTVELDLGVGAGFSLARVVDIWLAEVHCYFWGSEWFTVSGG